MFHLSRNQKLIPVGQLEIGNGASGIHSDTNTLKRGARASR